MANIRTILNRGLLVIVGLAITASFIYTLGRGVSMTASERDTSGAERRRDILGDNYNLYVTNYAIPVEAAAKNCLALNGGAGDVTADACKTWTATATEKRPALDAAIASFQTEAGATVVDKWRTAQISLFTAYRDAATSLAGAVEKQDANAWEKALEQYQAARADAPAVEKLRDEAATAH